MAVPGDAACRPVMACTAEKWGELPVDAATQYVDAFYTGSDSDGSAAKPWQSIADAMAAVAPGGLIALAEGIYVEDVYIADRPIRLWGVCPDKVAIVGDGSSYAAVNVREFADGTEIGGVTVRGPTDGIQVAGSQDVLIDRVRVHGPASSGISVQQYLGTGGARIVGSLIEESHGHGVIVFGSAVSIAESVVRGTLPENNLRGVGVHAQLTCDNGVCDPAARASVTVTRSVVEQNQKLGVSVGAVDMTLEGTVVRGTMPEAVSQLGGRGIGAEDCGSQTGCATIARANLVVKGSLVEQNHETGVSVSGSDATIENTVVRGNLPRPSDGVFGVGMSLQLSCTTVETCDPATRSNGTVRASLIQENHEVGLLVGASDATIESTVVRGTLPRASDQIAGRGIDITLLCPPSGCVAGARGRATVTSSLIDRNHDLGLHIAGSDAEVDAVVVRQTLALAANGSYGDGIAVTALGTPIPASAKITRAHVEGSARAGVANFGAHVAIGTSRLLCNVFDLEGETSEDSPFSFEELGELSCGCPEADGRCVALSTGIQSPAPITTSD
jgi:hypothetical protein